MANYFPTEIADRVRAIAKLKGAVQLVPGKGVGSNWIAIMADGSKQQLTIEYDAENQRDIVRWGKRQAR